MDHLSSRPRLIEDLTPWRHMRHLRDCFVCGAPIYARPYQKDTVRTCSPKCAKELAHAEHPDLKDAAERLSEDCDVEVKKDVN